MPRRTGIRRSPGLRRDLGGAETRKWFEEKDGDTIIRTDIVTAKKGSTKVLARTLEFLARTGKVRFVTQYGSADYEWSGAADIFKLLALAQAGGLANGIIRSLHRAARLSVKHGNRRVHCSKKQKDVLVALANARRGWDSSPYNQSDI